MPPLNACSFVLDSKQCKVEALQDPRIPLEVSSDSAILQLKHVASIRIYAADSTGRGQWLQEKKKKKEDDDSDEEKEKKDSPANKMRRATISGYFIVLSCQSIMTF